MVRKAGQQVVVRVKTAAKQALGAFACYPADRMEPPFSGEQILALTGRTLQVWLDAICGACSGRSTTKSRQPGPPIVRSTRPLVASAASRTGAAAS